MYVIPDIIRTFVVWVGIRRPDSDVLGVLELPPIAGELFVVIELSNLIIGRPPGLLLGGGHVPRDSKREAKQRNERMACRPQMARPSVSRSLAIPPESNPRPRGLDKPYDRPR